MLFSSLVFLFCFLPAVVIGYFIIPKSLRNGFLLLASLFFYAWGEPTYLVIMLTIILVNYITGIALESKKEHKKIVLTVGILVNLGFLAFFKYADFFIVNFNAITNASMALLNIALPIGISFYIFQAMSYSIDVYRGVVAPQKNLIKFALYVSLFPQLIAGPIVKYRDVAEDIENRQNSIDDVAAGMDRFIVGLGKKVVLANVMGEVADNIYAAGPSEISPVIAWVGAIAYSLQIFFDFSGYSDMAIGLGRVFGFHFLENFNYPYISASITEFWRRWHMSLSSWFKEYVYIPLGGNRVSATRNNINLLIVFFTTGLWHGASWNFIIWGLWHGMFLMIEKRLNIESYNSLLGKVFRHIYVILAFVFGWVFFRADDLTSAVAYIKTMLGLTAIKANIAGLDYYVDQKVVIIGILALIFCYPWKFNVPTENKVYMIGRKIGLLCILLYAISAIAASTYNPFIYFRF